MVPFFRTLIIRTPNKAKACLPCYPRVMKSGVTGATLYIRNPTPPLLQKPSTQNYALPNEGECLQLLQVLKTREDGVDAVVLPAVSTF